MHLANSFVNNPVYEASHNILQYLYVIKKQKMISYMGQLNARLHRRHDACVEALQILGQDQCGTGLDEHKIGCVVPFVWVFQTTEDTTDLWRRRCMPLRRKSNL